MNKYIMNNLNNIVYNATNEELEEIIEYLKKVIENDEEISRQVEEEEE